eukprot:snap_masked-scaffold_84-processed-gene-0.24-mRNA-1 protein AED:1.00 eAED:1.00 QI:0/0/0/0/1/1/3/0/134
MQNRLSFLYFKNLLSLKRISVLFKPLLPVEKGSESKVKIEQEVVDLLEIMKHISAENYKTFISCIQEFVHSFLKIFSVIQDLPKLSKKDKKVFMDFLQEYSHTGIITFDAKNLKVAPILYLEKKIVHLKKFRIL